MSVLALVRGEREPLNQLEVDYAAFIQKHPHVFSAFVEKTRQVAATGRSHYSADAVVHAIRWDHDIAANDGRFKIKNGHVAYLARHSMEQCPQFAGINRTCSLRSRLAA